MMTLFIRFFSLLALLTASSAAFAQDTTAVVSDTLDVEVDVSVDNGEARIAYGAAIERAQEVAAAGTSEGFQAAAEAYLEAVEIAENSGDDELIVNVGSLREAAVAALSDAGAIEIAASSFASAGSIFLQAADIAALIDNPAIQAQVTANAGTAFIQAEDFARAAEAFGTAFEIQPDDLDHLFYYAVSLRNNGQVDESVEAFVDLATRADEAGDEANLTRANETAGRIFLAAARDEIQAQNYRAAITELDRAAQFLSEDDANLNTFYANAYYRIGVGQVQSEQYSSARSSLQQAQRYARTAGRDQIVQGAQQQLDYIQQIQSN